jgi:Phage tail assembly chaperone protein
MKNFVVYLSDGSVVRSGLCQDETFEMQKNDGEYLLEAIYTGNQYVVNGQLVDMPPQPSEDYVFDYQNKVWVFDTFSASQKAYARRNQLLNDGPDRISPMWWSSMTLEQQQAWSQYRQALLDVPNQSGFPVGIVWPVLPEN